MSIGLQRLREEPDRIRQGAIDKGEDPSIVDSALELDTRRRQLLGEADGLKAVRNAVSKQIGDAIRGGATPNGPEVFALKAASTEAGERITTLDRELGEADAQLQELMLRIPNPADADVPVGDESANQVVRTWGAQLPKDVTSTAGTWSRKPHWEVGEHLRMFDLERGAKITGSGFPVYTGAGSKLQRALIDFMLDIHTSEHGMTEVWPPAVVNTASARGTGQIPDKEDLMYVIPRDELYLVPTAEVPVTNLLEWLTARAEVILQRLGLAYRVLLMATRDMGFVQAKKYDLEVWSPGVERWLEVSSCSNFRDYQARRMAIRYRPEAGAKPELVHTLNGSGLALARTVAAILETYQQPDGRLEVPHALRPYMRVDFVEP